MKTALVYLQFAFFLKDTIDRPDIEFEDLNSKMLNTFNGIPTQIPVPRELPADIPIKTLRSENNEYSCNLSRSRIDFIFQRANESKPNTEILKDFNSKVAGLIEYITKKQEISRFGMVARYFHHDNTAIHTLRSKYFNSNVDGACELSLRFNKKSESFGFEINDVLEISSAEFQAPDSTTKGILIQRDINNMPKQGATLSLEVLSKISKKYASKISEQEVEALIK